MYIFELFFVMEMEKQSLFYQLKIAEKNILAFIFVVYVLLHFLKKNVKVEFSLNLLPLKYNLSV